MKFISFLIFILLLSAASLAQLKHTPVNFEDLPCIQKNNLSIKERRKIYPFNLPGQVALVSFYRKPIHQNVWELIAIGLPVSNDTVRLSELKEIRILSDNQVEKLTDLLYNIGPRPNSYSFAPPNCYEPQNAILFIDSAGRAREFIEICFLCHQKKGSSAKVNTGLDCKEKLEMIKSFFVAAGIKYGTQLQFEE